MKPLNMQFTISTEQAGGALEIHATARHVGSTRVFKGAGRVSLAAVEQSRHKHTLARAVHDVAGALVFELLENQP